MYILNVYIGMWIWWKKEKFIFYYLFWVEEKIVKRNIFFIVYFGFIV